MANLSNINNKFLVTTTGEVLIGQTSNNGNRLQITGADGASYIYLKTDVATTGGRIGFNGDDLRVFNQQASGELNLGTAGTTRLTINSAGIIGIGPSTTSSEIYFNYNNTNNKGGLKIDYSTGQLRLTAGESGNTYHQAFYTNGSEKMRINSFGQTWLGGTFTGANIATTNAAYLNNLNAGGFSILHRNAADVYLHFNSYYNSSNVYEAKYGGAQGFRIDSGAVANGLGFYKAPVVTNAGDTQTFSHVMQIGYGANNNVGIGTTGPDAKLHIYGGNSGATVSGNSNLLAIETNGNNGIQFLNPAANNANINFGDPNNNENGFIQYQHSVDAMRFRAGGTTILNLVGGNVGIGVTGPGEKLEVDGNAELKGNLIINKFSTTAPYADGEIRFTGQYDRYVGGIKTYSDNPSYPDYANGLDFFVQRHVYALPNGHRAMRITSEGNVAIGGTFGTDSQFRVELKPAGTILAGLRIGYANTSQNYYDADEHFFRNGIGSNPPVMKILASGNVGIGVTSPPVKLSINGWSYNPGAAAAAGCVGLKQGNNSAYGFVAEASDTDKWLMMGHNSSHGIIETTYATTGGHSDLYIKTGSSNSLILQSSGGDVGVGVTNPVAKLDVDGSAKIKTRELSWYRCGPITSGNAYRHIKTTLAGNGMHIMGGIIVTGYAYGTAVYGEGSCMFHNSANTIYSLNVTNRGSWGTFVQNPYLSSDNYIVFVLRHNTYAQPILDLYQYYTPYPWRNISVSAETTSNSTTGVY